MRARNQHTERQATDLLPHTCALIAVARRFVVNSNETALTVCVCRIVAALWFLSVVINVSLQVFASVRIV